MKIKNVKETANLSKHLPDTQEEKDERGVNLQKVGIRGMKIPLEFLIKDSEETQKTQAIVSVYVDLHEEVRGINMSFLPLTIYQVASEYPVGPDFVKEALKRLRENMECNNVYLKIKFPYYFSICPPESHIEAPMYVDCVIEAREINSKRTFDLTVEMQTISTCPCSKKLSLELEKEGQRGAPHMQRGFVKVTVRHDIAGPNLVFIEDVVNWIMEAASNVPYPVVKRIDEQAIAVFSWDYPKFVEDVARDLSLSLNIQEKILDWVIVVEHEESIHPHSAVAVQWKGVEGGLR